MIDEYESFIKSHWEWHSDDPVTLCGCGKVAEQGRAECFRCRVASIGFGFRGGGFQHGRKNFAERTNAEFIAEHVGDPKREGIAHLGSQEWSG